MKPETYFGGLVFLAAICLVVVGAIGVADVVSKDDCGPVRQELVDLQVDYAAATAEIKALKERFAP
tara:strand:- start:212 stop:409 length:198 start_codon:yes stop_codon:yes gene_type:complete